MRRMELVKRNASYKGYAAIGSVVLTSTLLVYGFWLFALFGTGASAWFLYRWFAYRAKWGLRF